MTPESGPTNTEGSVEQKMEGILLLLLTINEVFVYKVVIVSYF